MIQPIFDGHNDLLLRLLNLPEDRRDDAFLRGDGKGQLDLPRIQAGSFAGGMFAIYIPSPDDGVDHDVAMGRVPYDLPLPERMPRAASQAIALDMAGILLRLERVSKGALRVCRTAAEIEAARTAGAVAAVMHMEGAEAIGTDLDALHAFHAMGLRTLGPVWSRPTAFGHGVPFRFPSDGDTGPGLTPAGRDLVRECNALRIMLDLSHLNAKGLDDVAALSDAPLVATHSGVHAISPSSRNLTDRQLDTIAASGGLVGLNFAVGFLRPDGGRDPDMDLDVMLRHLDHLLGKLGEGGVALGSDFDGAVMPAAIGDAAGLPALVQAMRDAGWGEELIGRIAWGNWIDMLRRTWGG
ncbi:dipeptidase [Jannaschia rubra]|uniref:Membrane dipeptidase (Peptidase family M19) n=1 Tax=Jannaschia rubra TaxID=282197 RepID=A0A0M6XRE2_9RHOB|nr:dipeptidase [Jannaschia rubra]CTQ33438.1 Membrane dipeptidase (Peptidase family M19) [Jannaschia rubra]SFG01844.1 dipeptidase AC. Metallo peptidase. MEROPS family M19 [Jannaschia rubra]